MVKLTKGTERVKERWPVIKQSQQGFLIGKTVDIEVLGLNHITGLNQPLFIDPDDFSLHFLSCALMCAKQICGEYFLYFLVALQRNTVDPKDTTYVLLLQGLLTDG